MKELLIVTPSTHPDLAHVSKALDQLEKLHEYINEKKNEVSSINHVFNAQKRLSGKFEVKK